MVTGEVVLCDNNIQIVGFVFSLFGCVSRADESRFRMRQFAVLEDLILKILNLRWLGGDGKPQVTTTELRNQLTKKSANWRLPSSVISSPGDRERVRTRRMKRVMCGCTLHIKELRTHPHSMETEPLCRPGTTAAQTRTSRRPPRSRCTRRLQRRELPFHATRTPSFIFFIDLPTVKAA